MVSRATRPPAKPKPAAAKPKLSAVKSEADKPKRTYTKKERPALDLAAVKVSRVDDEEMLRRFKPSRGARDPEQRAVDKIVTTAWESWDEAGRPTEWLEAVDAAYYVTLPVEQYETLKWRIQNAGQHLNMKIKFGDTIEDEGYAEVVFVAMDKPERPEKEDAAK